MICSITPTSNREQIIGDALRSVMDWCDRVLVIHLPNGVTIPDRTLDVAREAVGEKLHIVSMQITEGVTTISDIRNFGLKAAEALGATWACQLDTDERMILNGVDIPSTLGIIPENVQALCVGEDGGSYDKPRFFRIPSSGEFMGRVHEEWVSNGKMQFLPHVRFHELPKTKEQLRARQDSDDIPCLIALAEAHPKVHRWRYLLAETLDSIGKTEEAILHHVKALALGNAHERAWSHFRLASVFHSLGRHQEALRLCALGMSERPDACELSWFAGIQCLHLGRPKDAIRWSDIARQGSWIGNGCGTTIRTGFRELRAFFDGPYLVMADAFHELSDTKQEAQARIWADWASKERETFAIKGGLK